MSGKWQFSLGYLFLETFWIALGLALSHRAYWLYDIYRSFYDGWYSPDKHAWFWVLVIGASIVWGTAIGGLFGRMRLGAVVVATAWLAWIVLALLLVVLSTPVIQ